MGEVHALARCEHINGRNEFRLLWKGGNGGGGGGESQATVPWQLMRWKNEEIHFIVDLF